MVFVRIKMTNIEQEIINRLQTLRNQNENGTVYITEGHTVNTKRRVQKAKRNYDMVFLKKDSKKLFHSYTNATCKTLISSLDFDVKDIQINSKSNDTINQTQLLRELLLINLKKAKFGTVLNRIATRDVIDGSVITRTEEKNGKPETYIINMENFWTQFDEENPEWFLERVLMNKYDMPENWDISEVSETNAFTYPGIGVPKKGSELWIFEGMCPQWYVTEDYNDTNRMWMRLYITDLFNNWKIQEIQILGKDINDSKYDYAQLVSHEGRFIGVGVPEELFDIQRYLNMNLTSRYKRGQISALGLLQMKKGAGLTTDLVDRLTQGSIIPVENIGDIAAVPVGQVGNDNFTEETALTAQGDRLTGATEVARGQRDRQATLGQVNIEAGFSNNRFDFMRQNLATMIESILYKWCKTIIENMKPEEVIRVTDENLRGELAKEYSQYKLVKVLEKSFKDHGAKGIVAVLDRFNADSFYDDAFISNEWKLKKEFAKNIQYEVDIAISDQFEDKQGRVNNILQALQLSDISGFDKGLLFDKAMELVGINKAMYKGNEANATATAVGPQAQQQAGIGLNI